MNIIISTFLYQSILIYVQEYSIFEAWIKKKFILYELVYFGPSNRIFIHQDRINFFTNLLRRTNIFFRTELK